MRLIDADKVLDKMRDTFDMQELYLPIHLKELIIDDMETVNAVPVIHAKWIKSDIGGAKICSSCNAHMGLSNFRYCPNCGAKMDTESEGSIC